MKKETSKFGYVISEKAQKRLCERLSTWNPDVTKIRYPAPPESAKLTIAESEMFAGIDSQ